MKRAVAALAVLVAGVWLWSRPGAELPERTSAVPVEAAATREPEPVPERAPPRTLQQQGAARPTAFSLRGAELDGAIGWNADGSVRIDRALRDRFDHLLSAVGELSLADIRRGLEADVAKVASAEALARLLECFDRYTAYLAAVDALEPGGADRLAALHQLRVRALGPEMAHAFFEEDEQAAARALARQAVLQRTDMTDAERQAALEVLDAQRSALERELAAAQALVRDTEAQTAAFEAQQVDAQTRRRAREAQLGAPAAQRLADLDVERERWAQRLAAFRQERTRLTADDSLDAAARARALEQLLQRDFSEPEQRRVRAVEQLAP